MRTLTIPLIFFVACVCSMPLRGQTADSNVHSSDVFKEAHEKRARAGALKSEAAKQYGLDKAECSKVILVSACLTSAMHRQKETIRLAHNLDEEGREIERTERTRENQEKAAKRAAEEPIREAKRIEKMKHEQDKEAAKDAKRAREEAKRVSKTSKPEQESLP